MSGGGNDHLICQWSAFAAAAAGDRDAAASLLQRAEGLDPLRISQAIRLQVAASAAVSAGRADDARGAYGNAIQALRNLDFNLEATLLGLEFEAYLGERFEDARAAGEAAAAWFAERGGARVVERYHSRFAGTPIPGPGGPGAPRRTVPVDAEQPA